MHGFADGNNSDPEGDRMTPGEAVRKGKENRRFAVSRQPSSKDEKVLFRAANEVGSLVPEYEPGLGGVTHFVREARRSLGDFLEKRSGDEKIPQALDIELDIRQAELQASRAFERCRGPLDETTRQQVGQTANAITRAIDLMRKAAACGEDVDKLKRELQKLQDRLAGLGVAKPDGKPAEKSSLVASNTAVGAMKSSTTSQKATIHQVT